MPAPQITTSAVGALIRSWRAISTRPASLSTLPDRLDRQLAGRAQRDRVDAVLPEACRDGFAVQGPDAALLRLARIVGQLPESCPELALERGRRSFGGVALWDLALAIQYLALGRTAAVAEDPPEQQEGLALERVAGGHEVVLELDHEAGAPLGVTQQPHGRFEGLIARGQLADLRVSLGELTLDGASGLQHQPVGQIDASGRGGDEDERPHEPGAERAHIGSSMVRPRPPSSR